MNTPNGSVRRISVHFSGKATVDVYIDPNQPENEIENIALEALDQGHGRTNEISVNQILFEDTQPDSLIFTIPDSKFEPDDNTTPFTSTASLVFDEVNHENEIAILKFRDSVFRTDAKNVREVKINDLILGLGTDPLVFIRYDKGKGNVIVTDTKGNITSHSSVFMTDAKKSKSPDYQTDKYGSKFWKNEKGQLHRTDGPAVVYSNGTKKWYLNGLELTEQEWKRKVDLPELDQKGNQVWKNEKGQYHRLNGPAVICKYGSQFWIQNGQYHRTDGPALEFSDGTRVWYQNGKRHRTDGPAYVRANGTKKWYLDGIEYTEDEWKEKIDPPTHIDSDGKMWLNEKGQFHRKNGPALILANGSQYWYQNGQLHRTNGPASILANGSQYWFQKGEYHRTDGPAIELYDGTKRYYLNGIEYTEQQWKEKVKPI